MRIKVVAKTSFAIIALVALIAMVGYIESSDLRLLTFAQNISIALIIGGVIIAALIHLSRLLKR